MTTMPEDPQLDIPCDWTAKAHPDREALARAWWVDVTGCCGYRSVTALCMECVGVVVVASLEVAAMDPEPLVLHRRCGRTYRLDGSCSMASVNTPVRL